MVKPVYNRQGITIYHGDCLEILPQLDRDCYELIVTDPPYGIGLKADFWRAGRGKKARCISWDPVKGDENSFDPGLLLGLNVPMMLWGANYYADRLPPSGGWLVWDKRVKNGMQNDGADAELAWTNCVKGVRVFRHVWNGMWRDSERTKHYHPTQKPVALFRWILGMRWLEKCRAVLDPYMGSGPCAIACIQTGRTYVGIEIERQYVDTAIGRCEMAFEKDPLFGVKYQRQGFFSRQAEQTKPKGE